MRISRRLPLPARPLPFFAGWVLLVLGVLRGLAWDWSATIFNGAVLIQILTPARLFDADGARFLWLALGLLGLGLLVFSLLPRAAHRGGRAAAPMRFFPLAFLLGLFLMVFGATYLFDVNVAGDQAPGGFALFVSLNYAALDARPVQGTTGFAILAIGLLVFTLGSFGRAAGAPKASEAARPPLPGNPRPRAGAVRPPADVEHALDRVRRALPPPQGGKTP